MGQTHTGTTVARRVRDEEQPRRRMKLAHRRHRLIGRWSQYESSSEDDVSALTSPRGVFSEPSGSLTLKELHKLSQSYADKSDPSDTNPGHPAWQGSTYTCGVSSLTTTTTTVERRSVRRVSQVTVSSAETLVADEETAAAAAAVSSGYRRPGGEQRLLPASRGPSESASVIRPLRCEDSARVRLAEVRDSPESGLMGPEAEMVGHVARLTVLAEEGPELESAISWKLSRQGSTEQEMDCEEEDLGEEEEVVVDGEEEEEEEVMEVSVAEVSKVREPSSILPVPGSPDAGQDGIAIPTNAIFGSSKRRKRSLANRTRSCQTAVSTTASGSPPPPAVPRRPASRPPRTAEKTWLRAAVHHQDLVRRENERNQQRRRQRQQSGDESTPIWGHRRTKSVAASHMIDRQTGYNANHRRAVSMRDSMVDNDRAYNLLKCLDSGLRLWCKLSSDGYDSSILISDKTGNLLEVADDTQTTVICRMGGSVRCRVDISEAICV